MNATLDLIAKWFDCWNQLEEGDYEGESALLDSLDTILNELIHDTLRAGLMPAYAAAKAIQRQLRQPRLDRRVLAIDPLGELCTAIESCGKSTGQQPDTKNSHWPELTGKRLRKLVDFHCEHESSEASQGTPPTEDAYRLFLRRVHDEWRAFDGTPEAFAGQFDLSASEWERVKAASPKPITTEPGKYITKKVWDFKGGKVPKWINQSRTAP